MGLGSPGNNVFTGSYAAAVSESDRVAVALHVFHHDHAVSAFGHGCPSHDLDRLSSRDRGGTHLAGANQPNDCKRQAGRKISGPASEPIAGGAGKWRLIPVRVHRFGEHEAQAIEKRSELRWMPRRCGQPIRMFTDDPAGVGKLTTRDGAELFKSAQRDGTPLMRRPVYFLSIDISVWPSTWC